MIKLADKIPAQNSVICRANFLPKLEPILIASNANPKVTSVVNVALSPEMPAPMPPPMLLMVKLNASGRACFALRYFRRC